MQPDTTPSQPSPRQRFDDLDALDPLTRALIDVGADALSDDAEHGKAWGMFADWAWRQDRPALGAIAADIAEFLDTDARSLDSQTQLAVLAAVSEVHRAANLADPTAGAMA